VHSPKIERIEVAARGDVRRAKLYYLRDRVGRSARVRERRFVAGAEPSGKATAAVVPVEQGEGTKPPPDADVPETDVPVEDARADDVVTAEQDDHAAAEQPAGDGDETAESRGA